MTLKKRLFVIATFFLLLGISCYFFLYPNKFHFINIGPWQIEAYKIEIKNSWLMWVIYASTSYCHAIFMTFYSVLITGNLTSKAVYQWGFFWGVADSTFELLQLKERPTINSTPSDFWLVNKANRYLESGHFDIGDIIFIWLGIASSFYLWRLTQSKHH